MINLIPPAAKRAMKREYWMRVGVVWLMLLTAVIMVAAALTTPAFVLVSTQLQAYESQMQTAEAAADEQQRLVEEVKLSNQQAQVAYTIGSVQHIIPYLSRVTELSGSSIELQQVSAKRNEARVVETIEVAGTAATRQSLTAFSQALEFDPLFDEAKVPLSNLAEQEDISFMLSISVTEVK